MKVLRQTVYITDGGWRPHYRIIEAKNYRGKICVRYSRQNKGEMYPEYLRPEDIWMLHSEQLKTALNNLVRQFKLSQI